MEVSAVFMNASSPIEVRVLPSAKVTEVSEVVSRNAWYPIDVTPAGMVMEVSAAALKNAPSPIDVSELVPSNVMEVRGVVPGYGVENARSPIDVTLAGMVMDSSGTPLNASSPITISVLPAAKVTEVSSVARLNAPPPIDVTLAGMVMEVSEARWNE
jgi:hypothetical protein